MVILVTKKLESKLKHFKKSRYARIFGIHNIQNWICTSKQAGNTLKSDELRSTVHRTNQIKIFLKIYEFSENSFFHFFSILRISRKIRTNPVRSGNLDKNPDQNSEIRTTGPDQEKMVRNFGPPYRTKIKLVRNSGPTRTNINLVRTSMPPTQSFPD